MHQLKKCVNIMISYIFFNFHQRQAYFFQVLRKFAFSTRQISSNKFYHSLFFNTIKFYYFKDAKIQKCKSVNGCKNSMEVCVFTLSRRLLLSIFKNNLTKRLFFFFYKFTKLKKIYNEHPKNFYHAGINTAE